MSFRVVLYCPDRHLTYDGRTPEAVGVGGGVTARVRMARALARLGHAVTQVVNCPRRETIDGVEYVPLDAVGRIEADIAVFNTSGGALDLTPVAGLNLDARLRVVWIHGTQMPRGLERMTFDALYAVSNFVGRIAIDQWRIPVNSLFVTYNGFEAGLFDNAEAAHPFRDPYQLTYFSHPSKGLDTARAVLDLLREVDSRFHLEVAGGERLWGGAEAAQVASDGVSYHGLIGQAALTELLLRSTYSLQMQDRQEPFGLSVVEAMRAGVVVIASPVGAIPELIADGTTGVLIRGDHRSPEARRTAAGRILDLHRDRASRAEISGSASSWAPDTDTLARAWTQDWKARLGEAQPAVTACSHCAGRAWRLVDGDHCLVCAWFARVLVLQGIP